MENATKALIIAGAILVSILLISIGIALINSNKDVTNSASKLSNGMATSANTAVNKILNGI